MELLVDISWKDKDQKSKYVEEWVDSIISVKKDEHEDDIDEYLKKKLQKRRFVAQEEDEAKQFFKSIDVARVDCKFSHPYIRSRLEKLMGTNVVSLTDRLYMQQLQERILEEYADVMDKRIADRENDELERVKGLVLTGKIPMNEAPPEMSDHPVMLIEEYCNALIAARRALIKTMKYTVPKFLYYDDTPDPPSSLSILDGHAFRRGEIICTPPEMYCFITDEEDLEKGYMFTQTEIEKLKYESPDIKQLKLCEGVEDMYNMADEIIGEIKGVGK